MIHKRITNDTVEASLENISRVNCTIAKEFEQQLLSIIDETKKQLTLNLEGVRFIDTQGFEALKKIKKDIIIKNASQDIIELFELLQIKTEFRFIEN